MIYVNDIFWFKKANFTKKQLVCRYEFMRSYRPEQPVMNKKKAFLAHMKYSRVLGCVCVRLPGKWDVGESVPANTEHQSDMRPSRTNTSVWVCLLPGERQKLQDAEEQSQPVVLPLQTQKQQTSNDRRAHNLKVQRVIWNLTLTQKAEHSVSTRHTCRDTGESM